MSFRQATIVGWTQRGKIADLESSMLGVLESTRTRAKVSAEGKALLVVGPDPTLVASLVRYLPGVSWVSIGYSAKGFEELTKAASRLARNYLRGGKKFRVLADGGRKFASGDVAGAVVSAALGAAKGSRVDEGRPNVTIRAAFGDLEGVVGVELAEGPGGTPTGGSIATCLVSGGKHSSVLGWMALLAGYRAKMVHAFVDEQSLLAVGRLYAELSHRVDPACVSLEVLRGGAPPELLDWRSRRSKGEIFAGFHSGCTNTPSNLRKRVDAPLFLMPEESIDEEYRSLSLKEHPWRESWKIGSSKRPETASFGGVRADVSEVLDGLR